MVLVVEFTTGELYELRNYYTTKAWETWESYQAGQLQTPQHRCGASCACCQQETTTKEDR